MCEGELTEYFRQLQASAYAESSVGWKRHSLGRFCSYVAGKGIGSVKEVTRDAVEAYKLYLKEDYRTAKGNSLSCGTYYTHLSALSGFFRWLVVTERILSNHNHP